MIIDSYFSHSLFVSNYILQNQGDSVDLGNCMVRPDVRIDMSSTCRDYDSLSGSFENVTTGFLYPAGMQGLLY